MFATQADRHRDHLDVRCHVRLLLPGESMVTVDDNLESVTVRSNPGKIVRTLNRGMRQRAIADRVNVRRSTLRMFVRALRRS